MLTAHTPNELRSSLVTLTPELFGRALRLSRSRTTAEDLVQDTVLRAMRFESHYQAGTNVRAWVYQILFSVFITRCRRGKRERKAMEVLATDPCAWTKIEHAPVMQSLSPSLSRALSQLPDSFRQAVELVDLKEMSYKDAASQLGIPVGTIMSRLYRGRRLLAAAVRDVPALASLSCEPSAMAA